MSANGPALTLRQQCASPSPHARVCMKRGQVFQERIDTGKLFLVPLAEGIEDRRSYRWLLVFDIFDMALDLA